MSPTPRMRMNDMLTSRPRRRLVVLALSIAVAVAGGAQAQDQSPESEALASLWSQMRELGIGGLRARFVSVTNEDGRDIVLFGTEPQINTVIPDGPGVGKLQVGDAIVAVDSLLITTKEAGRRLSYPPPGQPLLLTLRRDGALLDVAIRPDSVDRALQGGGAPDAGDRQSSERPRGDSQADRDPVGIPGSGQEDQGRGTASRQEEEVSATARALALAIQETNKKSAVELQRLMALALLRQQNTLAYLAFLEQFRESQQDAPAEDQMLYWLWARRGLPENSRLLTQYQLAQTLFQQYRDASDEVPDLDPEHVDVSALIGGARLEISGAAPKIFVHDAEDPSALIDITDEDPEVIARRVEEGQEIILVIGETTIRVRGAG